MVVLRVDSVGGHDAESSSLAWRKWRKSSRETETFVGARELLLVAVVRDIA